MVNSAVVYIIDVVNVRVNDKLLDGLRDGFGAGLLERFRFKEVGNLLSE
jgi:hypothetical protein